MTERVFLDTSVLIRYFAEDDPARTLAAARLIDDAPSVVISSGVLIEAVHALRTSFGVQNPALAKGLIDFMARSNVELADADQGQVVLALRETLRLSGRRIPDGILAAAAEHAGCDWIATFDESFTSPTVPSRLL